MPKPLLPELRAGDTFGKLTLVEKLNTAKWRCLCECGNECVVASSHLRDGHTRSCGCLKVPNLVGRRFGMLTVIARAPNYVHGKAKHSRWLCKCDCGNTQTFMGAVLQRGDAKSCGCQRAKWNGDAHRTHGASNSPLYRRWETMKSRCMDTSVEHARNYRDRGIAVCDEWLGPDGYAHFQNWALANGYSPELTIDRIDNDKGYSPDNCRWVTHAEQHLNTRNNLWLEYRGERYTCSQLSKMFGINDATLRSRIKQGWDIERAVETPVDKKQRMGESKP